MGGSSKQAAGSNNKDYGILGSAFVHAAGGNFHATWCKT